jgi:hypothetical protein
MTESPAFVWNDHPLTLDAMLDLTAQPEPIDGMMGDMAKKLMKSKDLQALVKKGASKATDKAKEYGAIGKDISLLAHRFVMFDKWIGTKGIDTTTIIPESEKFWARFPDADKARITTWRQSLHKSLDSSSDPTSGDSGSKITAILAMAKSGAAAAATAESDDHNELFAAFQKVLANSAIDNISSWAQITIAIFRKLKGSDPIHKDVLLLFFVVPSVSDFIRMETNASIGALILHACSADLDDFHQRAATLTRHLKDYHTSLMQQHAQNESDKWSSTPIKLQNVHSSRMNAGTTPIKTQHQFPVTPLLSSSCNDAVQETTIQAFRDFGTGIDNKLNDLEIAIVNGAMKNLGSQGDDILYDLKSRKFRMDTTPIEGHSVGMATGLDFIIQVNAVNR